MSGAGVALNQGESGKAALEGRKALGALVMGCISGTVFKQDVTGLQFCVWNQQRLQAKYASILMLFNDSRENLMVNLSVRRLDDETSTRLKTEAGLQHMSVNTFLLRLIRRQLDLTPSHPTPRRYHDLDHLAGTWSAAEADLFLQDLADFVVIDPELWR